MTLHVIEGGKEALDPDQALSEFLEALILFIDRGCPGLPPAGVRALASIGRGIAITVERRGGS